MKIAILGWGSLLWDTRPDFEQQHNEWQFDGPLLKLEFSRVSVTRNNALTLVLDNIHGTSCRVAYALSKRKEEPDDAICDLRCRESTIRKNIGFYFADGSRTSQCREGEEALQIIKDWATSKKFDVVIWTDLESNFKDKSRYQKAFSIATALDHIQEFDSLGKIKSAEYIRKAPAFIETALRKEIQSKSWFNEIP